MTHLKLADSHLTHLLQQAVIADKDAAALRGVSLEALSSFVPHRLPPLGPRGAHGCNWDWTCPGAPEALLAVIARHAETLQRQYDLA